MTPDQTPDQLLELIQRLQVVRQTQHLSPALADELLTVLPLALPFVSRQAARDALIRQAACLLPGCLERKANMLAALIRRFQHPTDEVRSLLFQARLFADLPQHPRSLRRILEKQPF